MLSLKLKLFGTAAHGIQRVELGVGAAGCSSRHLVARNTAGAAAIAHALASHTPASEQASDAGCGGAGGRWWGGKQARTGRGPPCAACRARGRARARHHRAGRRVFQAVGDVVGRPNGLRRGRTTGGARAPKGGDEGRGHGAGNRASSTLLSS